MSGIISIASHSARTREQIYKSTVTVLKISLGIKIIPDSPDKVNKYLKPF